jgi:hypothetical protein
MSEKYKRTYRGYLIDNHSPDPPIVTLEKLNAKDFEEFFLKADINHFMLYCKDHWGNSYYNTKIGKMHGGLKQDWVGTLVPILKKHNIEFNAYYCFEYDTYAPKAHPEWSTRDKDGEKLICGMPTNSSNAHWGMPCYETGYRDYILGQLKEIITNYKPDSLFIDIFGKSLCYCDACRKKFRKEFGYDIPEEPDEMMAKNNDLVRFLDESASSMLDDVKRELKAIDPSLAITINFASHYPKEIRDKLDYIFTEPWAGNWLSGAYARDTSGGKHPQLGPGDVSQVYNYQKDTIYKLAAAEIAAQNCRVFMYSEPMHYDGTLDFEEADKIGAAYREVEKFEGYLENRECVADIAIVQSDLADTLKVNHPIIARSIGRAKEGGLHRDALHGAMKLCDYSKFTWRVVPEKELSFERMKQFKMIILPDVFYMEDVLTSDLNRYVQEGGFVFATGETGMYGLDGKLLEDFSLNDVLGCSYIRKNEDFKRNMWSSFVVQTDDAVWKHCEITTPPVFEYTIDTKKNSARSMGSFCQPATPLTDTTWVNWGCPPPGKATGFNAIYENTYGKGKAMYTCFDFFTMENKGFKWMKNFFMGVLEQYVNPSVNIETENKNILEFACYDRKDNKDLIIHELSAMAKLADGDTPYIPGGQLQVSKDYKTVVKAQMIYPEQKELKVEECGDRVKINLESVDIHNMYRIEYK